LSIVSRSTRTDSTLIQGDLADEIGKLKRQDGKDLMLMAVEPQLR
jgi:hypothetical protein